MLLLGSTRGVVYGGLQQRKGEAGHRSWRCGNAEKSPGM